MATFITTATKELSDITPPRVVVAEIPRSEETFIMPKQRKIVCSGKRDKKYP